MQHCHDSGSNHNHHQEDHTHFQHSDHNNHLGSADKYLKRFFWVTGFLILLLFFRQLKYLEFILGTIIFGFGLIFFQHAAHEIKAKKYGMMTLVSLGVGSGYFFSALSTFMLSLQGDFYLEISSLIWVLLFGHFLEAKASIAAGDALQAVSELLPKESTRIVDGSEEKISSDKLKTGDIVLIKPGEKVPADGKIISGKAGFNEAHLTGESKLITKKENSQVIAGSICIDGTVKIKLSRVGENSTVGQIKKLVLQSQQTKPNSQRLADRVSGWLTIISVISAILTIIIWTGFLGNSISFSLSLAIAVLVTVCPHALGLAIPAVVTITSKLSSKNGLFIKDMSKLETVTKSSYIIFDKTGTLTLGEFKVQTIQAFNKDKKKLLKIVASLEYQSSHTIARSILKHFQNKENTSLFSVKNFKNLAGQGIQGEINGKKYFVGNKSLMEEKNLLSPKTNQEYQKLTSAGNAVILVANQKTILGFITLSDKLKPQAKSTITKLQQLGFKIAILTGDNKQVAQSVGEKLGVDLIFAEVLPQEKYTKIKTLQEQEEIVMMVGDGVNDAPALTQADVGIVIGAGTDLALESGDIILTDDNPQGVVKLVKLSSNFYQKMIENLIWAFGYNLFAIPAAAGIFIPFGFRLKPGLGALLMSLSSVIVVANAMRLKTLNLED